MRLAAGEHLVEDDPAGVDVDAGVRGAVLDLFGGEVRHGAEDGPCRVRDGVHGPDEAEVGHLDPPVVPYQDVLRLHVAVHEPGAVRGAERGEHRLQDVQGGPRLQRPRSRSTSRRVQPATYSMAR